MADEKRRDRKEISVIKVEITTKSERRRDKAIVMDMMRRETEEEIEAMMERTRIEGEIEMVGEMDVIEAMMKEIKTEAEIIRLMIEITTELSIEVIMATRIVGDKVQVTTLIIILSHRIINIHKSWRLCWRVFRGI